MEQVIGSTNSQGEAPKDRPLIPGNLWSTVYHHLGIDTNQSFLDLAGHPMPILTDGDPIAERVGKLWRDSFRGTRVTSDTP